jgi:hypothetical protein
MTNTELLPGSLFANRFEVGRAAGHGGMVGGQDEIERFAREAQLLSELRHPVGYTDIVSRVTAAELRSINGDLVGARAALEGALTRISLSAEKIPDAGMRQQFLTRVTENARAQQLAREWGLDLGGLIVDFPSGAKHP